MNALTIMALASSLAWPTAGASWDQALSADIPSRDGVAEVRSSPGGYKPRPDGPRVTYYKTGEKWTEGYYRNGQLEGLFTNWFKNGGMMNQCVYVHGERHGLFLSWHHNGGRREEGQYAHGVKTATWTKWDEQRRKKSAIE